MENRKRSGLTTAIFTGLVLGAAAGILLHYAVPEGKVQDALFIDGISYLIGNGFLRLMRMLVVPLVFCSLMYGSMSVGGTKKLGGIGVKTLGFYLTATALAVTAAILTAQMTNPGAGLNFSALEATQVTIGEKEGLTDTLLAIIPVNPVRALVGGDMLSVVLFALIVRMILTDLGGAVRTVGNLFSQFNNAMMQMIVMVMKLAPYGVFCLITRTFFGISSDAFLPLSKYVAEVMIVLATHYPLYISPSPRDS